MTLIDTHCHLDSYFRRGELPAVLQRASSAGLEAMIAVGTGLEDWTLYRDLSRDHAPLVNYSVGLHPCHVDAGWEAAVAQIEGFWNKRGTGVPAVSPGNPAHPAHAGLPVALGECGLDRFHLPEDAAAAARIFAWQEEAFRYQLEVACRIGCPVIIHSREAFPECVRMIDASGVDWTRVVFHCFSEGAEEVQELMRRGAFASFTGILTYKNAENVRLAARTQGMSRLMIETDAPYLAPVPHRGKTNEPAFVRHVAEYAAADVFKVSFDELAAVTTANAKAFFGIQG